MKLGIVGLPGVGKTTLFNALTGSKAETNSYGGSASAKPNIGQAKVPDERLDWLADFYHPKKYSPATIDFVDVAGVSKGGKSSAILQNIRQTDALVHVVRCFDNDLMFTDPADARGDAESLDIELVLADMEVVERRLDKAKKNLKGGDKKYRHEADMCEALLAHLSDGKPARTFEFSDEDKDILQDGGLLTVKPIIYAANLDEDGMADYKNNAQFRALSELAAEQGAAVLPVAAKFEEDIMDMDDEEAAMFMEELGLTERGLDRLIKTSYDLLGYISFLTAGEDDVHAWTIVRGSKAPKAAGKIHSDFERGFIRAEVIAFEDFKTCGSLAAAKSRGLYRSEGKEYVMKDGDVVNFLFNV